MKYLGKRNSLFLLLWRWSHEKRANPGNSILLQKRARRVLSFVVKRRTAGLNYQKVPFAYSDYCSWWANQISAFYLCATILLHIFLSQFVKQSMAQAKYWISIKTMKKMGEERKRKKKSRKKRAFFFIAATTRIMYGHIGCLALLAFHAAAVFFTWFKSRKRIPNSRPRFVGL